jgi:hypothetical protein
MLNKERPKIKVLQYMHGSCEHFAWSERINRRYCERHGYQYVLVKDGARRDRHECWQKIPAILEELRDCDYLLFLDSAAVFYGHDPQLETEFLPLLGDRNVMMAQDCECEASRCNTGLPNSDVIFMKNNDATKAFFADWDKASELDEGRCGWHSVQHALLNVVLPQRKAEIQVVEDYYRVQGRYGMFIRNYGGDSDACRSAGMQELHQRLTAATS